MIKPHGAEALNPRFVYDTERHHALAQEAEGLPSLLVSSATAANAVMLGGGYFTPLDGYMTLADAMSVAEKMQTESGVFFPVPVLNMVQAADGIKVGDRIALRDPNVEGNPVIAVMDVTGVDVASAEQLDYITEQVFGTLDADHPGVKTFKAQGSTFLSGPIEVLSFSYFQADFPDTFRTAVEQRGT